jgi:hypothetical protein
MLTIKQELSLITILLENCYKQILYKYGYQMIIAVNVTCHTGYF